MMRKNIPWILLSGEFHGIAFCQAPCPRHWTARAILITEGAPEDLIGDRLLRIEEIEELMGR